MNDIAPALGAGVIGVGGAGYLALSVAADTAHLKANLIRTGRENIAPGSDARVPTSKSRAQLLRTVEGRHELAELQRLANQVGARNDLRAVRLDRAGIAIGLAGVLSGVGLIASTSIWPHRTA